MRYRCAFVFLLLCGAMNPDNVVAQSKPEGPGRGWVEVGVGGARQSQGCRACLRHDPIGGLAVSGSLGASFAHGLGAALLIRAFQEFSFDFTQGSRYIVPLVQYSPPRTTFVTVNAGVGWGTHHGDPVPYANNGDGAVLAVGLAVRIPSSGRVALSASGDVLQSVSGTHLSAAGQAASTYHPRLVTVGVGLSVASARPR
jgi:hypothetical protein